MWLDVDDTVIQTYGYPIASRWRGYTGVKGVERVGRLRLHPMSGAGDRRNSAASGQRPLVGELPPWSPMRCRSPAAVEPVDRLFFAPIRRSIPAPWSPRPTRPEPDSVSPPLYPSVTRAVAAIADTPIRYPQGDLRPSRATLDLRRRGRRGVVRRIPAPAGTGSMTR